MFKVEMSASEESLIISLPGLSWVEFNWEKCDLAALVLIEGDAEYTDRLIAAFPASWGVNVDDFKNLKIALEPFLS